MSGWDSQPVRRHRILNEHGELDDEDLDGEADFCESDGNEVILRKKRSRITLWIVGAILLVWVGGAVIFLSSAVHAKSLVSFNFGRAFSSSPLQRVGFVENLARLNSMTPASVPTLRLPSAPVPSTSALKNIKKHWPYVSGKSDHIEFIKDPFSLTGENSTTVLTVEYPKGSYAGGKGGGIPSMFFNVFVQGKQRAMVSYEVAFSHGFEWAQGGKLPGLFGGDVEEGCRGGKHSDACFSLRLMWRAHGMGEVYAYIPTYSGFCDSSLNCTEEWGNSVESGSWNFTAGSWHTVTEVAILNSDPGKIESANGVLEVYFGATKAFEKTNVVFRTMPDVSFTNSFLSTFFGGSSSKEYASKRNVKTYFRNFQFFSGDAPSTSHGPRITAIWPTL